MKQTLARALLIATTVAFSMTPAAPAAAAPKIRITPKSLTLAISHKGEIRADLLGTEGSVRIDYSKTTCLNHAAPITIVGQQYTGNLAIIDVEGERAGNCMLTFFEMDNHSISASINIRVK